MRGARQMHDEYLEESRKGQKQDEKGQNRIRNKGIGRKIINIKTI